MHFRFRRLDDGGIGGSLWRLSDWGGHDGSEALNGVVGGALFTLGEGVKSRSSEFLRLCGSL